MKHTIKYIMLAFAAGACCLCGQAQNVQQLKEQAKGGNYTAMYNLANCYANGTGVARDAKQALHWYERASRYKFAPAQQALAMCYLNGTGTKRNDKKAWEYLEIAAKNGGGNAYYQMAQMCREGRHGKKSLRKYVEYLEKGAALNDTQSLLTLAKLYSEDNDDREISLGADPLRSIGLYQRAAETGDAHSQYVVAMHFANKDDMSRAVEYLQRAARGGHPDAFYWLGVCYYNGDGTPKNYKNATHWLKKADESGIAEACTLLGNIYYYGLDTNSDSRAALDYYRKAVDGGDAEAITQLSKIYLEDSSMITDADQIYRLFDKSATEGDTEGYVGLGVCYEKGIGCAKSEIRAIDNYEKAARNGNGFAAYRMYEIYANGQLGERVDSHRAIEYLNRAVVDEYADAIYAKGVEYMDGKHIERDTREGLKLLEQAAEMSSAKACAYLGNLYYSGSGYINKDYNRAFKYLEKFLNNPESVDAETRRKAYRNIAACYRFGRGTSYNETLADMYAQKAYDTYDIDAMLGF